MRPHSGTSGIITFISNALRCNGAFSRLPQQNQTPAALPLRETFPLHNYAILRTSYVQNSNNSVQL